MQSCSLLSLLILSLILTVFVSAEPHSNNNRLLQTPTYVTTSERGPTVQNHCNSNINRQELYVEYGLTGDIPNGGSISSVFNMNTSFIAAAAGGDWNTFSQELKNSAGKMFIFVGAWVIGLAIALLLFPFLLCCCICPWSCPLWNRKRQNMPYSKCQLYWPAIISLILLTIILVTSIVGIASRFKALASYNDVACASGVVIDDVTNGNVTFTDPTNYFTGIRTANTQLNNINDKIGTLNSEIAKLGSTATGVIDVTTKITTAMTSTAQVPSLTNSSLSLSYNTPLQSTPGTTTSTISSILPDILGNKSSITTFVGVSYLTLTAYQSVVQLISTGADAYTANAPSFTASISTALNQTDKYATDLQNNDKQVNNFFNVNQSIFTGLTIGEYVYYGILIGFSALMIIAVSCTVWGSSNKCRRFMYTLCVVMFLLCLIAFLYCIFVSVISPMLYYTCQYVQQNLNSKATLSTTLSTKFKLDAQLSGNISECIAADGNGYIISNILGTSVYSTIADLNSTYTNLTDIDTSLVNVISLAHTSMRDNITAFKKAQIADITDQSSLAELIKLSQASNYSCSTSGFTSDSWIPSISQNPTYVACQISGGSNSDSSTCTSSANFDSRATGCTGCMDTYDLFKTNLTYIGVNAALSLRYSDPTCSTFNQELANVWGNFYKQKLDVIGPVQTRAITAKNNADTVVNTVNYFTNIKSNIDTDFYEIVNQYGFLNGLNCQTVGQDVRLMKNVVCNGLFLQTYFARIIFGILSFALLFLMCCITCTGHRNSKSMQFEGMKYDDDGKNMESNPNMPQYNLASEQQFLHDRNNPYPQNPIPQNRYPIYV